MQNDEELSVLLARLAGGDDRAAAAAFREFEPLLRVIVRRQLDERLRPKFDSADMFSPSGRTCWTAFAAAAGASPTLAN